MSDPPVEYRLVISTAASEAQAVEIARGLVEERLAACVNVISGCCSIFRWEGKVVEEDEKILLVKTEERRVDEVRQTIRRLHSYDVPEIVVLPLIGGDPAYLSWISEAVSEGD